MFEGGVETLAYFSKQMAEQFVKMGYAVFFYNLKDEKGSAKRLRKFIKPGETVMITFNFQGLEKEDGVYSEKSGYVWDEYKIPCYNIAADHPYYYDNRLHDLPKGYHHISIDRKQEAYFLKYYPEYQSFGFLPLAGTGLDGALEVPYEKRDIDVIMTGNYTPPSFFEQHINWINDEYAAFYRGIIEELLEKTDQTVEEAALRHCEREMGEVAPDDFRLVMHKMIFIDLYVRNYWRGMVIKTLAEAGITVDVIGKGWEELECSAMQNVRIHPQTDSLTCLEQLSHAKVSVNVMPWFKDGAHDRVFNSILNGAVCVSDTSRYLSEELKEGEGVSYYDLKHLEQLPVKVKDLLEEKAGEFAKRYGVDYNITFSEQKPSTDTIAADMDNQPFRDNGKLLFRPGGHGALIENLNDLDADVIFIKNIDNVVPDKLKADTVTYKKLIAGVLVTLQKQAFEISNCSTAENIRTNR